MADLGYALGDLLAASHRARPEDLPGLATHAARRVDATDMIIHLVDYAQSTLAPLRPADGPTPAGLPVEEGAAGRAFTLTQTQQQRVDGGYRVWVPLLDGAERLGVLEVRTGTAPDPDRLRDYQHVAALLSELLMTRRGYGDAIEQTRRRLPMQLAAEIIWNLLPPLTFTSRDTAITAILEPCYDVGGDAFDYAINGTTLHMAIFDAVGHGIDASALTSMAISAYRNARRCGLNLIDTYHCIDTWITAQYPHRFVTAILGELDTTTGVHRTISAGHPGGLLLRDAHLVKALPAPTAMPLGLAGLNPRPPGVATESLRPGDRMLLYTDGIIEARDEGGRLFGLDRVTEHVTRSTAGGLSAPETLRRLVHAVIAYQEERLRDDATAVLVQWRPG